MLVGLLSLQLLWLNLITDGLLVPGLGVEPANKGTMRHPPRAPMARIFSEGLGSHVLWVGSLIVQVALLVGGPINGILFQSIIPLLVGFAL